MRRLRQLDRGKIFYTLPNGFTGSRKTSQRRFSWGGDDMGIFLGAGGLRVMRRARRKTAAVSKNDGSRGLANMIWFSVRWIRSGFRSQPSA
jgi:hypothetical protein